MIDDIIESPISVQDPPVIQAAKNAFKTVRITIDEKDEIFGVIRNLFDGKTVTSDANGIDFPNKKTAEKFLNAFLAELKKKGIFEQFNKNVTVESTGKGIFFTKKEKVSSQIVLGGAGSKTLNKQEMQFLRALEAGAAAIGVSGKDLKGPAGDFIAQYRVWKKSRDSEGRYAGFTLPLAMPDEKSARAFLSAFNEKIGNTMPGMTLKMETNRFNKKSQVVFHLASVGMKTGTPDKVTF